jgi:hypothetical protein
MAEVEHKTIEYEVGHAKFALVPHGGYRWFVREVDPDAGWTLIERTVPGEQPVAPLPEEYAPEELPTVYTPLMRPRIANAIATAAAAVFLFLALLVGTLDHLSFADILGCIIGFLWLVWWFTRPQRVQPRRPRERGWWFPV